MSPRAFKGPPDRLVLPGLLVPLAVRLGPRDPQEIPALLARQDLKERLVFRVIRDPQGLPVQPVLLAPEASLVPQAPRVLKETPEPREIPARSVLRVFRGQLAQPVPQARRAAKESLVRKALSAPPVPRVQPDPVESSDRPARPEVRPVRPAPQVLKVHREAPPARSVQLVPRAQLVNLDSMAQRVPLVP